ncbi:Secreted And Transmembrane Protein 1 [Manis pentadactyla]|nr:Secreted And Transmembrane Protein 1 [Manis pentadactyla]
MALELGTTRAVDPTAAEAWLLDLQGVPMEGCYGATCLRKGTPGRALRPSGQCWKLLLGPEEVWVVSLHDAPQVQEPQRTRLPTSRVPTRILVPAASSPGSALGPLGLFLRAECGRAAAAGDKEDARPGSAARECPEHQWSTQDPRGHADLSITPPSSQDALDPPAPGCLPACSERKQESPPHTHPRALVARGTATCFVFGWDDPTCTEGVVTVSRGACAVMSCTISHPLSNVTVCLSAQVPVCLSADGKNQPLVSRKVPGSPAHGGWQLRVHGAVAQLVIDGAQDAQAGEYTWHLEGFQRSIRTTTLSVSGAEAQEPEKRRARPFSPSQDPERLHRPPAAGSQLEVVLVIILVVTLSFLVAGMLAWHQRHRFLKLLTLPQMTWF